MEVTFFNVLKVDETNTINTQKGETLKRNLILQECGSPHENAYVVTTLGELAQVGVGIGDIVMARLRFSVHEYQGKSYMEAYATSLIRVAHKNNPNN